MCHLDIKPENIIVDLKKKTFKLIDFGYSCIEPFDKCTKFILGTTGYIPKYFESEKVSKFMPKVEANDYILINDSIPLVNNRHLVYRLDSYAFGRVLNFLKCVYKDNKLYTCFNNEKKNELIIDNIIRELLENDVYKRTSIIECYEKYFK